MFGLTASAALLAISCGGDDVAPSATAADPSPTSVVESRLPPAPSVATASGAALSTSEIVRRLRPSVVRIDTETTSGGGTGTGVIIDSEGHIVTNNHVIVADDGSVGRVTVTLADGSSHTARVVGRDPATDLAVLKIDAPGLTPAALGSSSSLEVGADVIAIGHALGLAGEPTVTRGVVSAKNRAIQQASYSIPRAIQTDASINPGNSGGPLVDVFGSVVGINTAAIVSASNIGFAISIDVAKPIIQELLASGKVQRAFLGVSVADITPGIAASFDLPTKTGAAIMEIVPGSPAAAAGLQERDIVVAISGKPITNSGDFLEVLSTYEAGATLTIEFYRDDDLRETTVTLTDGGS